MNARRLGKTGRDVSEIGFGALAIGETSSGERGRTLRLTRQRLPWLLVVPLMVAGSLGVHAAAGLFAGAPAAENGSEVVERSSSGAAGHWVVVLGLVAALALAVGWSFLRGRLRAGASAAIFFWLPLLAFSIQELAERLLRAEAAPFSAAFEPSFLFGLALQIPFGLVAFLLARLLVRVARGIVRALARRRVVSFARRLVLVLPVVGWLPPRIPALALGYTQRGPPRT